MFDDRVAYHAAVLSPDPISVSPYAASSEHSGSGPQQMQAELAYQQHRRHHRRHQQQQQQRQHRVQSQREANMDDLLSFQHEGDAPHSNAASLAHFPLVPSTGSLSSLVSASSSSSSSPFRQQADTSPAHAPHSSCFSSSAGRLLQPSARGDVDYELFDIFQMASASFDAEDARSSAFFQHSLPNADTELRLSPVTGGQQQQQQLPFVSPLHPSLSSFSLASAGPQHLPTLQSARRSSGATPELFVVLSRLPSPISQSHQQPFLTRAVQAEFVSNHQSPFLPLSPAAAPPPPPPSLQSLPTSAAVSPSPSAQRARQAMEQAITAKREAYSHDRLSFTGYAACALILLATFFIATAASVFARRHRRVSCRAAASVLPCPPSHAAAAAASRSCPTCSG